MSNNIFDVFAQKAVEFRQQSGYNKRYENFVTPTQREVNAEQMKPTNADYMRIIKKYGEDILASKGMQSEKEFVQHGNTSTYEHSISVTVMCLRIVAALRLKANFPSLVRGALLHDYCLYDWHEPHKGLHAFTHPKIALSNASRDFKINPIERNMILSHMFPLGKLPKYRESLILCLADKLCALSETIKRPKSRKKSDSSHHNL